MNGSTLVNLDRANQDTHDYTPADVPTAADLDDYGRWLAGRDDLAPQAMEPTPVEALEAPCDPADLDDDGLPWWVTMPTSPELDSSIELGPEAGLATMRFRGDRYVIEVAGRPERPADGYAIRDKRTGLIARKARWFTDAEALASELERNAIRAVASRATDFDQSHYGRPW